MALVFKGEHSAFESLTSAVPTMTIVPTVTPVTKEKSSGLLDFRSLSFFFSHDSGPPPPPPLDFGSFP